MFICIYDEADSTNILAKNFIKQYGHLDYNCVGFLANNQTNGVGKHNKQWLSKMGNLHLSIILRQGIWFNNLGDVGWISLLMSLCVRDIISKYLMENNEKSNIQLKWPNDILVEEKKISGILIEVEQDKNGENHLVVGIGVNLIYAPAGLDYETICLQDTINKIINNISFANELMDKIHDYFIQYKNFPQNIIINWLNYAYGLNKMVNIKTKNIYKSGIFHGLTKDGFMILNNNNNQEIIMTADIFNINKCDIHG